MVSREGEGVVVVVVVVLGGEEEEGNVGVISVSRPSVCRRYRGKVVVVAGEYFDTISGNMAYNCKGRKKENKWMIFGA